MPINFVEVDDSRTLDPTREYFVLDGKIGEIQVPDNYRSIQPSAIVADNYNNY
jgi:hypothetical protein